MKNELDDKKVVKDDPFLTKNVWIKRIGFIILVVGLFPALLSDHKGIVTIIFIFVVVMAVITYFTKHIIDFFKSFYY
jgi:ABC-type xylose transport system permease subunit